MMYRYVANYWEPHGYLSTRSGKKSLSKRLNTPSRGVDQPQTTGGSGSIRKGLVA